MKVLCIIESFELLKNIKNSCEQNDGTIKGITPDDDIVHYLETLRPDVVILQDSYEDVSIKFLLKMIGQHPTFENSVKVLVATGNKDIEALTSISAKYNMHLVEEKAVGMALCTKVKAMLKERGTNLETPAVKHLDKRKVVLYISDNKFMHVVIKDAFQNTAIELIEAYDGDEALSKIKVQTPDLILTDVDIPGLSGIDICKAVKHSKKLQHIPVIIYSSYEKEDVYSLCNSAGATEYFEKNMNPKEFIGAVMAYL